MDYLKKLRSMSIGILVAALIASNASAAIDAGARQIVTVDIQTVDGEHWEFAALATTEDIEGRESVNVSILGLRKAGTNLPFYGIVSRSYTALSEIICPELGLVSQRSGSFGESWPSSKLYSMTVTDAKNVVISDQPEIPTDWELIAIRCAP